MYELDKYKKNKKKIQVTAGFTMFIHFLHVVETNWSFYHRSRQLLEILGPRASA